MSASKVQTVHYNLISVRFGRLYRLQAICLAIGLQALSYQVAWQPFLSLIGFPGSYELFPWQPLARGLQVRALSSLLGSL